MHMREEGRDVEATMCGFRLCTDDRHGKPPATSCASAGDTLTQFWCQWEETPVNVVEMPSISVSVEISRSMKKCTSCRASKPELQQLFETAILHYTHVDHRQVSVKAHLRTIRGNEQDILL